MSPHDYGVLLWAEVNKRLRKRLAPRIEDPQYLDGTLHLIRLQLEYEELSPRILAAAVRDLPTDPQLLAQHVGREADTIAERVCAEQYVADCVQLAKYVSAATGQSERDTIAKRYWATYAAWTYGSGKDDRCCGVLGARLIDYLKKREAATRFAEATSRLDEKVFTCTAFDACARAYCPGLGMRFENFFKRHISQRAGDVARDLYRGRHVTLAGDLDLLAILAARSAEVDDEGTPGRPEAYLDCRERFRQKQSKKDVADRKVAAFELRHKAYLDPDHLISRHTLALVKAHTRQLQSEFLECQHSLRVLEDKLNAVEVACDEARGRYHERRRTLLAEGWSPGDLEDLNWAASQATKKQLDREWTKMNPTRRHGNEGLRLSYQRYRKTFTQARGRVEKWREEWEKWAQCRLPWVRKQDEIAALMGGGTQGTIAKYVTGVEESLRICMESHGQPLEE